jgi:hypothetical protein
MTAEVSFLTRSFSSAVIDRRYSLILDKLGMTASFV